MSYYNSYNANINSNTSNYNSLDVSSTNSSHNSIASNRSSSFIIPVTSNNELQWKIFSCEGVFEPPIISSQTAVASDKMMQLNSTISFPGLQSPEYESVKPNRITVLRWFLHAVNHMFTNNTNVISLDGKALIESLGNSITTIETKSATEKEEIALLLKWLKENEGKIVDIVNKTHKSNSNIMVSTLMLDLVQFYDEMIEAEYYY